MAQLPAAERVDSAMREVPRAAYLPPDQQPFADVDRALPIGYGQTNSQPTTVRNMLVALDVRPGHRVLDVGSGSGWTTALLARLVGPTGEVLGVERVPELIDWGRANLAAAGMPWARIIAADAHRLGAAAYAPYDRILVSAMASQVPQTLCRQLAPDGILVVPASGQLWRVTPDGAAYSLGHYAFVPLLGDQ
ncbi:MAG: protein-L-isoaspartate O-methyltransferase family protein [Dermatophilaceae bacterium]